MNKNSIILIISIILISIISCTYFIKLQPKYKVLISYQTDSGANSNKPQILQALQKRIELLNLKYKLNFSSNNIELLLRDKPDIEKIRSVLSKNVKLEFWHTHLNTQIGNKLYEVLNDTLSKNLFPGFLDSLNKNKSIYDNKEQLEIFKKASPLSAYLYPYADRNSVWIESSIIGYAWTKDTVKINEMLNKPFVIDILNSKKIKLLWEKTSTPITDEGKKLINLYLIKTTRTGKPELDIKNVTKAKSGKDIMTKKPIITLEFNDFGKSVWTDMTEQSSYERTGIAMVLNNKVLVAPIASAKISGGITQITGSYFNETNGSLITKELAQLINISRFPYQFDIISWNKISQNGK